MQGLLLKLLDDPRGSPGKWFWKLFAPIRADLDRQYWCFTNQPWMASPAEFCSEDLVPLESAASTGVQLWPPGALSRYADKFAEETIELWAIDPRKDDPAALATRYGASGWSESVIEQQAAVWLLYTDSTCWEIFALDASLLDRVSAGLQSKPWVEVFASDSQHRAASFGAAGLAGLWKNFYGQRGPRRSKVIARAASSFPGR